MEHGPNRTIISLVGLDIPIIEIENYSSFVVQKC
jgi:hypothetical protein